MSFQYKLLSQSAKFDSVFDPLSAGYRVFSDENIDIAAGGIAAVKTNISFSMPEGVYGMIVALGGGGSSFVCPAVCDGKSQPDQGVVVLVHNATSGPVSIKVGDPIGQLVLNQSYNVQFEQH